MRVILTFLALAAAMTGFCAPAVAQCEHWQPGPPIPGTSGWVKDAIVWDDGSGPALYLSGAIWVAGGTSADGVVKWDGTSWHAVGSLSAVSLGRLAVYKGQLFAAGDFYPNGNLLRYNGVDWETVPGAPPGVYAMVEYNGKLVVAGKFSQSKSGHIRQWDGQSWDSMKGGVELFEPEYATGISTLAVHDGQLFVGGDFKKAGGIEAWSLAAWNGAAWQAVVPEHLPYVQALASDGARLLVAGSFDTIGGTTARNIAAWDGAIWSAFGDGLDDPDDMVFLDGNLCVKQKRGAPGGPYTGVYRWNGAAWELVTDELTGYFDRLTIFDDRLVLAGLFFCDGPPTARNIATWDGQAWRGLQDGMLGPDGPVQTFGEFQGEFLVGGEFASIDGRPINALAAFDGVTWRALGDGIGAHSPNEGEVTALGVYGDRLVVSGGFQKVGDVDVWLMGQWDGREWSSFPFNPMEVARAMTVWNGWLIIGGDFIGQDQHEWNWDSANYIVQFNGRGKPKPVGNGMNQPVLSVCVYKGDLYAAGKFWVAGFKSIRGIARWDGAEWQQLGPGIDSGYVYAMTIMNDSLIAAGLFQNISGVPHGSVARWDGSTWHTLGTGVSGYINAVTLHNGELIVGGDFEEAGGVPARNIARWDGQNWHALDDGLDAIVYALGTYKGRLYAGGRFAGSGSVSSPFLAVWGCSPCPADCDGSGSLDIDDFICFQTLYATGDSKADCDENGDLDPADFICFQMSYGQGCP